MTMSKLSKAISSGQALALVASFAVDTPWTELNVNVQPFIELPPKERGKMFAEFLRGLDGVAVAATPAVVTVAKTDTNDAPDHPSIINISSEAPIPRPQWVRRYMHPTLAKGPIKKFSMGSLERWLHPEQKVDGQVKGMVIYSCIKRPMEGDTPSIDRCLGLRELDEIRKKGIQFFSENFAGKVVLGWRSVVTDEGERDDDVTLLQSRPEPSWFQKKSASISRLLTPREPVVHKEGGAGSLRVPCLSEIKGDVRITWVKLDQKFDSSYMTFWFKK